MKRVIFIFLTIFLSGSAFADSYLQSRKIVRDSLIACLKDPENAKYSAAYNSCLLEASDLGSHGLLGAVKKRYL